MGICGIRGEGKQPSKLTPSHMPVTPLLFTQIQLPPLNGTRFRRDENLWTESEEVHPQDMDISTGDRLDSLRLVAKKVAQSTGQSFQKLAQKEHDDLNSLDKMAECIAKSTSDSLRTLEDHQKEPLTNHDVEDDHLDPQIGTGKLNILEMAAKRVAQTTGEAVEALVSKKEGELDQKELAQQTAAAEHVVNSTGHAIQRTMLDPSQQNTGNDESRRAFLKGSNHTSLQANHPGFTQPEHTAQHVKEQEKSDMKSPAALRIPNGKLYVPIPVSPSNENMRQLPSLPRILNESIRQLPSPSSAVKQLEESLTHNTRKLPPVPTMNKDASELTIAALSNGYHDSLEHSSNTKRNQWTRSPDSISEYSTTESGEPELNGLPTFHDRIPWSLGAKDAAKDLDLKTNPLKRVSHTAEMVAESTGKAVHKLTTTLPKC